MFNFLQTCQVLKNAVSMKDVPKYEFISEKEISDDCRLTQKVKENHKRWLKRIKKPLPLICKGCCEIDNFTGNELLRIFHDLIDKKNKRRDYCFKPGNLLYFSKSRKFCAAVMFTKTKLLVTTPSPKTIAVDNDDEHYQRRKSVFLYTKLFDDRKVEYYKNKQNKYQSYYSDTIVEDFRKEAMEKFSLFLISKVSEFNLFLFGSSFLAMLFHTAYNISRQKNPHFQSIDFDIPFAACVNFAFCNNMTGKLTDLFGDVRFRKNCGTSKLKHIKETARELIKRYLNACLLHFCL